ncbi:hypothetical protein MJM04_30570, partial [Salmonella enterica subsp. enterica serovar Cerro]|nr:hypothetical protein [Salmonella enterica subsp. enterica serovar Cerro]
EQVTALEPEQVWVADITYLPLRSGTACLSLVTDACSRKIVGYLLRMALASRRWTHVVWMGVYRRALITDNNITFVPGLHHQDILW